jgi:antitoxin component HigA of HigAB toxin-antitoxin module
MNFPKPAEIRCQEDYDKALAGILKLANNLCELASDYGVVLTIRTEPRKPLAMGNYDLLIELSSSHTMYRSQS